MKHEQIVLTTLRWCMHKKEELIFLGGGGSLSSEVLETVIIVDSCSEIIIPSEQNLVMRYDTIHQLTGLRWNKKSFNVI